ncbi:hypothetical protein GcC1_144005 [Golovinomyces cichoracearum]|uniref:Uncharacterized protein n=1 Tax=Golovinomyces cichoracearum TaxID=62708 RepID=A0A420HZE8_9PEZI|nr:hypothetical protein GcC1_144005 [Golovinomyces cichoracearum]
MDVSPSAVDNQKCAKYGRFLQNVPKNEANAIFWSLFGLDLLLLIIASSFYAKQTDHHRAYEDALKDPESAEMTPRLNKNWKQSQLRCLVVSTGCVCIYTASVIIEAFAGLALAFCHKEDLIFMYWGFFFLLSIGSFIAILGVALSIVYTKNPPWNVPLGTPVLVFAYVGFAAQNMIVNEIKRWNGREDYTFLQELKNQPFDSHRRTRQVLAMRADEGEPPSEAKIVTTKDGSILYYFPRLRDP